MTLRPVERGLGWGLSFTLSALSICQPHRLLVVVSVAWTGAELGGSRAVAFPGGRDSRVPGLGRQWLAKPPVCFLSCARNLARERSMISLGTGAPSFPVCGRCPGYWPPWLPRGDLVLPGLSQVAAASQVAAESGCLCHLHGQMPGGLAGCSVAFASSRSHMVLKCQPVPEWGPCLGAGEGKQTSHHGSPEAPHSQAPAVPHGGLNQHLLSCLDYGRWQK